MALSVVLRARHRRVPSARLGRHHAPGEVRAFQGDRWSDRHQCARAIPDQIAAANAFILVAVVTAAEERDDGGLVGGDRIEIAHASSFTARPVLWNTHRRSASTTLRLHTRSRTSTTVAYCRFRATHRKREAGTFSAWILESTKRLVKTLLP